MISDRVDSISEKLDIVQKIPLEVNIPKEKSPVLSEGTDFIAEESGIHSSESYDDCSENNNSSLASCSSENCNNSSTSTQPFKRYVLIERLNANTAHFMHVWGPNLKNPVIPVRRVADDPSQKAAETRSSQVSTTILAPQVLSDLNMLNIIL